MSITFSLSPKNLISSVSCNVGYTTFTDTTFTFDENNSKFFHEGSTEAGKFEIVFNKPVKIKSVNCYDSTDNTITVPKFLDKSFFSDKRIKDNKFSLRFYDRDDSDPWRSYRDSYAKCLYTWAKEGYQVSVTFEAIPENYIDLHIEGVDTKITAYDSVDSELGSANPLRVYNPSGTSSVTSVNLPDVNSFYCSTNGECALEKIYDGKDPTYESYFTDTGDEIPFESVSSFTFSDTGFEFSFEKLSDLIDYGVHDLRIKIKPPAPKAVKCNVTYQLGNCSCNISDSTVEVGKDVSIVLTCDEGYKFENNPVIIHQNKTINLKVSADGTSANINFTPNEDFIVSATATKIGGDEPTTQVSRFIDLFLPDSSQLEKIKEIRWITASGSGDSVRGNDINTNISAMYQTFIKIPSNGVKNCKIAGYDTKISIPYTDSVLTDVKSEEVMFEEKYNSAMDYEPHTQCKIYLPFCGIFSIPTNYVIGKTIQLVYSCNLYTCDCECRIYSDHTLVQSESGKFGFEYPFRTIERTNVRVESSNYFSDLVPKIIITRHNFVTLDEHRPISYTAKASEINGYFEADNIQFDIESLAGYTWITKDDVDHIESALRGGVVNNK